MPITEFTPQNADFDLTSSIAVLTITPDASNPTECIAFIELGDGAKDLDGTGGDFELVITVRGQTIQPSPQTITFGTEVQSGAWSTVFPVPANAEVVAKVKSPNAADSDVDVVATLYDLHPANIDASGRTDIGALGGVAQRATDLAEIAQYLIANSAEPITDYVDDDSLLAKMLASGGDISDYDDTTDSQEAIADAIEAAADALYTPDSSDGVVGTEGNTYAACASDNGTRWSITDAGSAAEAIAVIQLGSNREATSVYINGYFDSGASRIAYMYAYDWTTSAYVLLGSGSADKEMRNDNSDNDYVFPLPAQYTKPSATVGEVRIKFVAQTQNVGDALQLDYIAVTGASSGAVSPSAIAEAVHTEIEPHLQHIPLYTGDIHYVDGGSGDDQNDGHVPTAAFATIGAAITASSAGGRINTKAGTYSENSLELPAGKDGLQLHGEIGTTISTSSGTEGLLVTGANCRVNGIVFSQTGGRIGVKVAGAGCHMAEVTISSGHTTGFDIDGSDCWMDRCQVAPPTTTGFDFGGGAMKVNNCFTIGNTTSKGFHVSAGNFGYLKDCSSNGHETTGYQVDNGVNDVMVIDSATGPDDGDKVDNGTNIAWRNFKNAEVNEADLSTHDADAVITALKASTSWTAGGTASFETIIKAIYALARGKVTKSGDAYTWYDDNDSTTLFTLTIASGSRTTA
jgi:hypothetical protein